MTTIQRNKRRAYIDGLRAIADALEAHSTLVIPTSIGDTPPLPGEKTLIVSVHTKDSGDQGSAWAVALAGAPVDPVRGRDASTYYTVEFDAGDFLVRGFYDPPNERGTVAADPTSHRAVGSAGTGITIVRAEKTCDSDPSQWDAWTDTGRYLYLRYRWGVGRVHLDSFSNDALVEFDTRDAYDGSITLTEFCERADLLLGLTTPGGEES